MKDGFTHVHEVPPPGAAADWTISQNWDAFTADEHAMWDRLFARQSAMLPGRASEAFLRGIDVLRLEKPGIPDYRELNARLMDATGWQVVAVPGLVPDDVFGHVPMLADPVFADYMVAYGEGGLRSLKYGALKQLARLYWYTVEFGLIREAGGLRIYGAGIVSSYAESVFALDSDSPNRIGFDLARVMRTDYRIDDFQQNYFVIDSLDQLLDVTVNTDFAPLYAANDALPPIPIADILPGDVVITRGTQDYATAKA